MPCTDLTDICSITSLVNHDLTITSDVTVRLNGLDVMVDGVGAGFDFWVGQNVTRCYFGYDYAGTTPAQIAGTIAYFGRGGGGVAHILSDAWGASANGSNYLLLRRSRGTPASPSGIQSGDYLGTIGFSGYTSGSAQIISAQMRALAAENFGSNRGTKLVFSTILTGASSLSDRMWFEGSGQIALGNQLLLAAGQTGAGTAPLKLQSGSLNSTAENGALEYDGTHLYFTIGSTRYQLDQQ